MKRMLIVLSAVVSFSLNSVSAAAGIKVPKEICIELISEPGIVFCLGTKASSTIKYADNQKVKYYAITGSFDQAGAHFPLSGTGYITGNFFRFHISSQFIGPQHHSVDGFVDLSVEPAIGSVNTIFTAPLQDVTESTYPVQVIPCSERDKPPVPVLSAPVSEPAGAPAYY